MDGVLFSREAGAPVEGAFDTVARVVRLRGAQNVWIVSQCAPGSRKRALAQLEEQDFYARTGMLADHVIFVDRHEEKVGVCRELGIRDFVDDALRSWLRCTAPWKVGISMNQTVCACACICSA
jgi:hypothetical protein